MAVSIFDTFKHAPFAVSVFADYQNLPHDLRKPKPVRLPDEHEFYILKVGYSLSQLLISLEVLDAIPVLLGNFRAKANSI